MKWKILLIVPLLLVHLNGVAQEKEEMIRIKGKVTTANDKPVANAFIFIDGEILTKKTNTNGRFRIRIPESSEKIAIYTIDNRFAETDITNKKRYDLTLSETLDSLNAKISVSEEEMVDLGYFKSRADKLTSDIGVVKSKKGEESYYDDIYQMIKGEIPGVNVVGRSITIRGPGSFNQSNQPLFVVDGSPIRSISHIMPSDVASISVLKGASASMYGARGSNGVIVIKMKQGSDK
ncbi:MAG: TonB-dependent receptor plug domain-containing protein [Bacteroidales bacterium]|nr:TonB-dependent receptor plug domain-containing protein [Bacteroidales bacterium]